MLKLLFTLALFALPALAAGVDPYAGISVHTLANGMTVVLAPSSNARNIEVEVRINTGWNAEDASNLGIAHLTEHVMFRDDRLGADQSYLQLIKEKAGGNANGVTGWKSTSFFASVPPLKGVWVLNEFSRMLIGRTFSQEQVDKCKNEVLLEMGEAHNFFQAFLARLNPLEWEQPDFFETEFDIHGKNEPDEDIRRGTRLLTVEQAKSFYERYYVPANMVLFYAGPFREKETLAFVKDTFEAFPEKPFTEPEEAGPKPRMRPYLRSRVATRDSWISIGTKFWDIAPEDEISLKLYLQYLSHRIMKKLRNESGETYSPEDRVWVDENRYGYAVVSFETPRESFSKNVAYLKEVVRRETWDKQLTDADLTKARELWDSENQLVENGSDVRVKLAQELYEFRRTYDTTLTPQQVLEKLNDDAIRARLHDLFHPARTYLSVVEPPLLFRGEHFVFGAIVVIITFFVWRLALLRGFHHTSVRYVRKIKYQPAFVLATAGFFLCLVWSECQFAALADRALLYWNFFQSSYLMSEYAEGAVFIFATMSLAIIYLSLIPRKLIVADNFVFLKSVTYFSRKIPRSAIREVISCRPYHLVTKKLWKKRPRVFHIGIWKKGILLDLKRGVSYYLGFRDADKVLSELEYVLGENTVSGSHAAREARRGRGTRG